VTVTCAQCPELVTRIPRQSKFRPTCSPACYQREFRFHNPRYATEAAKRHKDKDPARHRLKVLRAAGADCTLEEVRSALEEKACQICGTVFLGLPDIRVDHSHQTHRLRGSLCHNCNTALGLMRDDPVRLKAAAAYLERHLDGGRAT
jgi:endogenous inhibitor of DNA gyrase (YacG/DUF329 family)